jgi:SsrA-binding protein
MEMYKYFKIIMYICIMKNVIDNRKAYFNYSIGDKYTAGIQLIGTEIKSIREGKLNFNDSFCLFINDELFVRGIYISDYSFGTKHENVRDRKLLLTKKELKKIQESIKEKGLTIIPLKGYFTDTNYFKIDIGIGKGKKEYDKRETIKKRETEREVRKLVTT